MPWHKRNNFFLYKPDCGMLVGAENLWSNSLQTIIMDGKELCSVSYLTPMRLRIQ